jgi:hypothetical protein
LTKRPTSKKNTRQYYSDIGARIAESIGLDELHTDDYGLVSNNASKTRDYLVKQYDHDAIPNGIVGPLRSKLQEVISVLPNTVKQDDGLPLHVRYFHGNEESSLSGGYNVSASIRSKTLDVNSISPIFKDQIPIGSAYTEYYSPEFDPSSDCFTAMVRLDDTTFKNVLVGKKPVHADNSFQKIGDSIEVDSNYGKVTIQAPCYDVYTEKDEKGHQIRIRKNKIYERNTLMHEYAHHIENTNVLYPEFLKEYEYCRENGGFPQEYMSTSSSEFMAETTAQLFYPTDNDNIYGNGNNEREIRNWVLGFWASQI